VATADLVDLADPAWAGAVVAALVAKADRAAVAPVAAVAVAAAVAHALAVAAGDSSDPAELGNKQGARDNRGPLGFSAGTNHFLLFSYSSTYFFGFAMNSSRHPVQQT
jgi:hypothetical protein